ncbi:KilA-N domain-containing protein, partial [Vogesella mureinivorans]|uniref:KilA-N domain-containing protein n=1 Tax=Vogesella mureinivorans TaxID=657276 RepID=UPI00197D7A63
MELIIADVTIRQDEENRFCLNDLHKAAGGEEKHSPNRWTRTDGYQSLVAELTPEMAFVPALSVRGGAAPGTYVCKELVYAYAMWISPQFSLKVIRAYDQLMTQGIVMRQDVAQQAADDPATFLAKAVLVAQHQLEQQKAQVIALEQKVAEQAPKAAAHDMLAVSDGDLCITDAA